MDGSQVKRRVLDLSGTWQIAEGFLDKMPNEYDKEALVPGLVDMSKPAFEAVAYNPQMLRWRDRFPKDPHRDAFWYCRTFKIESEAPSVALLKVHKAKYTTRVYINGNHVGDNLFCFTPGYFDLAPYLKGNGKINELVIRIGSSPSILPPDVVNGLDGEKRRYIPGIYDKVELILSETPHIVNVQVAPNVSDESIRVVTEVKNSQDDDKQVQLDYVVREWKSGREVFSGGSEVIEISKNGEHKFDTQINIPDCRLWSPEDPFLYEILVDTGKDTYKTRFGVRSFSADPETGRAVLNGKPYMLRGSNVCIFRFFEDSERGNLPWDEKWVRKLHRKFKSMHWNTLRYCVGFPPEQWYKIADEEGILIQDEYPIWFYSPTDKEANLDEWTSEGLANEYRAWMRERWNHPCVVIWDAQNETRTKLTGKAIQKVRHLDLSDRPWENGWSYPVSPNDFVEAHPYLHVSYLPKKLVGLDQEQGIALEHTPWNTLSSTLPNPVIINEYGRLWINRKGQPTWLSAHLYKELLDGDPTPDRYRYTYARYVAALTEFWRARRKSAGVLHFCGLGYSRPADPNIKNDLGGETSDNWIDVENLEFEPYFEKYVGDSFYPIGIYIDFFDRKVSKKQPLEIPVVVINDFNEKHTIDVEIFLVKGASRVTKLTKYIELEPYGKEELMFTYKFPADLETGDYQIVAQFGRNGRKIRSVRDFSLLASLPENMK